MPLGQLITLFSTESSTSHDMHVVKLGNGIPNEDLVEEVWRLCM